MLTIEYVKNCKYDNAEQTAIEMIVKFEEFNEELPFLATSYDTVPHGIELYNSAKAGLYGVIAEYVPPPAPEVPENQPNSNGTQTL
jgi:hypothetical protein